MKKKGLIIGIIVLIVVLILGWIGWTVYDQLKQEEILRQEVSEIESAMNNVTVEETAVQNLEGVTSKLDEIKTTGDCAIVEQAIKECFKDIINTAIDISDILKEEQIQNMLSTENYQTDGPNFVNSTAYISDVKTRIEEEKNSFLNLCTEETVMSYINQKTEDEYLVDLYREIMIGEGEIIEQEDKENFETSIEQVNKILDVEEQIINLLKNNKGNWTIENNQIMFNSNQLVQQYNELLNELQ